jgi:hypothetical protein
VAKFFDLYGRVSVNLVNFKTGMQEAGAMTSNFMRRTSMEFRGMSKFMTGMGRDMAILGGAAAWGMLSAFKRLTTSRTELVHLSDQLKVNATDLARMKYALSLVDIELEDFGKGLAKQQKFLAGTGSRPILRSLGLDPDAIKGMGSIAAFEEIVKALAKVEDANKRTAAAMAIWGKTGGVFLKFIADGKSELAGFVKEAEGMGITISKDSADAFEKIDKLMVRTAVTVKMLGNQFLSLMTPSITKWYEVVRGGGLALLGFAKRHEDLTRAIGYTALGVIAINAGFGMLFLTMGRVFSITSTGLTAIGKLAKDNFMLSGATLTTASSFGMWAIGIGLVGGAIGLLFSGSLRDYVRNLEVVRKATDFFYIAFVNVWENLKMGFAATWDLIKIGMKTFLVDMIADLSKEYGGFLKALSYVPGYQFLGKVADEMDSFAQKAGDYSNNEKLAFNKRQEARREERDRNIQAAYDSSIYGNPGGAAGQPGRAPAATGGAAEEHLKKATDQNAQLIDLMRQLVQQTKNGGGLTPPQGLF